MEDERGLMLEKTIMSENQKLISENADLKKVIRTMKRNLDEMNKFINQINLKYKIIEEKRDETINNNPGNW